MQKYDYGTHSSIRPGTIRLLKLLPGDTQADVEANLLIRWIREERGSSDETFLAPEPYEALSYHWGRDDPNSRLFVKILAESQSYFIPIRPNLDLALRRLRHRNQARYLWVDGKFSTSCPAL